MTKYPNTILFINIQNPDSNTYCYYQKVLFKNRSYCKTFDPDRIY